MDQSLAEQAVVARLASYGGWIGLAVGATFGLGLEPNLLGLAGGALLGFALGRILSRGIAALIWCLLVSKPVPESADYDDGAL
jgi:hypothetical protein